MKTGLEVRAARFAAARHKSTGALRRGTAKPYIVHPAEVATILRLRGVDRETLLAAAWLHDTLEDTQTTEDEIRDLFGGEVARLVRSVTNVATQEAGTRRERAAINRDHLARTGADSQTLKLADIISNMRGLSVLPRRFGEVYVAEKRALIEVLTSGDPVLLDAATHAVLDAERSILGARQD